VKARLKTVDKSEIVESTRDFSPTRSRGRFEMSKSDQRLTRKNAQNLARAIESQRRPRSPIRSNTDPRFMHSTVSFRAKSPTRQKRKSKKKKIPFLTGNDTHNVAPFNYTKEHIKAIEEDEQLIDEISDELTTYEQIRKRITRLLESPRAREINRDGELTAALARIEGKISDGL
jgi:predicted nucleic acid-binding Zn ribbon protein